LNSARIALETKSLSCKLNNMMHCKNKQKIYPKLKRGPLLLVKPRIPSTRIWVSGEEKLSCGLGAIAAGMLSGKGKI